MCHGVLCSRYPYGELGSIFFLYFINKDPELPGSDTMQTSPTLGEVDCTERQHAWALYPSAAVYSEQVT